MSEQEPFGGLSVEAIQREILSRKDEITQAVVRNLVTTIAGQSHYQLNAEISIAVQAVVKQELMEEIKNAVVSAKPQILESLSAAISKVCTEIGVAMVKKAADNLGGYRAKKIIEDLFQ